MTHQNMRNAGAVSDGSVKTDGKYIVAIVAIYMQVLRSSSVVLQGDRGQLELWHLSNLLFLLATSAIERLCSVQSDLPAWQCIHVIVLLDSKLFIFFGNPIERSIVGDLGLSAHNGIPFAVE